MSEQETLAKAQNLGYVQPEDWKGEPPAGGFKTAEEFLEVSDNNLNLSKADNDRLHQEIQGLHEKIDAQRESARKDKLAERKRGYDAAYARYTREQSDAIKEQDSDKFATSRENERKLEEQQRREEDAAAQDAAVDTNDSVINQFRSQNSWFRTDPVLTEAAERYSRIIARDQPGLSPSEHVAAMKKATMDANPNHPAFVADPAPSMDGGGTQRSSGGAPQGARWQDVPAADKAEFERHCEDGYFTNDEAGRKEFLELYSEA